MAGLGPILVLAGPGSGKTRVLTQRVAYLVGSMGVSPYHIMAVTFTNKAAREMGNRVADLIGDAARGLTLGTFHAICARLLRRESEHLPFTNSFVIFDDDDQLSLVKRAVQDLNLDEKRYRPQAVHASISNAKNELILPDQFPIHNYRDEVVQRVYKRYHELLLANNAVDFDDLLLWTAVLLEDQPSVREKYAHRYEHVLVDEFQDTNLAQYTLLRHLASFHNNIFVVGDTDQSIYRWRGADYRNVLRFEEDYPDSQVILLEQNYRSTQAILEVAMAVIDRNPYRTPKRLFTDRGPGQKVILHEVPDDRVEATFVVETVASQLLSTRSVAQPAQPGNFAVMYRTNAQSRLLEEAFLYARLPYKLVGAQRFYGRREIKDIIANLRLVHNPSDEVSLTRIINVPPRAIGDKTMLTLRTQAQKAGLSMTRMLLEMGQTTGSVDRRGASAGEATPEKNTGGPPQSPPVFPGRSATALANFGNMLSNWIVLKDQLSPMALMDRILTDTDYHSYIDDGTEEGKDRWDNVMELRRLAAEYLEEGLAAFLEQVALVSDQDTLENNENVGANSSATLLTLHAAKGLEFPVVFIVGLNDGTLPHSRSFDDPEAMMEERRLFYVGITRAKNLLYLVYAQNRSAFGYTEPVIPSRFLEDIPGSLVEQTRPNRSRRQTGSPVTSGTAVSPRPERWLTGAQTSAALVQPRYQAGMRVQHSTWGEGMVLQSRVQDNDEIVDVFFANVGMKRVMASLAGLEIKP